MGPIRLFLLLVTFCSAGCLVQGKLRTVKNCGVRGIFGGNFVQERIVGGAPADWAEYPWMVTIHFDLNGLRHVCGGSVINEHWVVTAAHCMQYSENASDYTIYVGKHRQSAKFILSKGKKYEVEKFINHENYDPHRGFINDIALIRTAKPIIINSRVGWVNGICLPPKDEEPTGNAIATGWGDLELYGKGPDVLHEVVVPVVSKEGCGKLYHKRILDSQICAGNLRIGSCHADSGGPLIQQNSEGAYTLIGIVSHGHGTHRCGRGVPEVYTKVSAYIDWMDANMD